MNDAPTRQVLAATLLLAASLVGCRAIAQPPFLDEAIPVDLEENLVRERTVAPGVAHHHTYNHAEPWNITWARIESGAQDFTWRAVKAHDRVEGNRRVSEMAVELAQPSLHPVAAINGDFWAQGGRPVGLCVVDGRLLTLGNGRPAVAQTEDGVWHMDRFQFELEMEVEGASEDFDIEIDDVNVPADRFGDRDDHNAFDRTIIYTSESVNPDSPAWPPARLTEERDWAAIGFRGADGDDLNINTELEGELIAVDPATVADWPEDLYLIVGFGADADVIRGLVAGTEAEIEVECEEFEAAPLWALGGGPILVDDGEITITPAGERGFSEPFTMTQHPRSLIGWNDAGEVILMVIDGRQPGLSAGMTLVQCAEWMRDQGMTQAMNFDGGGSSSLWIAGEVVSRPSDAGGERSVTDGLVLLSPEPAAQTALVPTNANRDLGAIRTWALFPEQIELVVGETRSIHPRAYDAEGNRVSLPREGVTEVAVGPHDLASVARTRDGGLEVTALRRGSGHVMVQDPEYHNVRAYAPLLVGRPLHVVTEGFEEREDLPALELTQFGEDSTALSWTTDPVHEGERALAIDYEMLHGGTSAAYISLEAPLPEGARRATLWVHGDGGEAWLRGIVTDADGERFLVDFTNGTAGVNWEGWRMISCDLTNLRAHWDNPSARADAPFALNTVYLAQTRESSKTGGRIVFDEIGAEVFSTE